MSTRERFLQSVSLINKHKHKQTIDIPNETKLKLYGLYKQSIIGNNTTECPGLFSFAEKQKWNAWNDYIGLEKRIAMEMYCDEVDKLLQ